MNSLDSLCLIGMRTSLQKTLFILLYIYKMENMRMTELVALARERELRGYSKLRKAELIAFLQDNENQACRQSPTGPLWPTQPQ